jgi:PAS domain S-box-containing protein
MTNYKIELTADECKTIVEQFPIGLYHLDFRTQKFRNPNSVILKYTGYTKEEFENLSPSKLLTEESYQLFIERIQKIINKEEVPESVEFEIITKRGERYWVLLNSKWRYEDNVPIGAFCVVTNITEQKRIEKRLEDTLKRSQLYLDMAYNIFLALDINGNIILINKAGCNILGIDECFLIGQNWFDNYVPKDERSYLKKMFCDSMREGFGDDVISYENSIITTTGKQRLIRWRNTVIRDEEKKIVGSFSSGEDITEQKELEEKLLKIWNDGEKEVSNVLKSKTKQSEKAIFGLLGSSPISTVNRKINEAIFLIANGAK